MNPLVLGCIVKTNNAHAILAQAIIKNNRENITNLKSFFQREKGGEVGNDLLSHVVTHILPSVLVDLTAGFEMGPGVPPPLISPTNSPYFYQNCLLHNDMHHAHPANTALADTLKTD